MRSSRSFPRACYRRSSHRLVWARTATDWRKKHSCGPTDADGTNERQLNNGPKEQQPVRSKDGKWVYYLDASNKRSVKCIHVDGGSPETVVKSDVGKFALSPDGKSEASFEDRGRDHKLVLRLDFHQR